jgi:hypothetical protein
LPLTSARTLVEPFLSLEHRQQWSPLTVFARQRVDRRKENQETEGFLQALNEAAREQERTVLRKNYRRFMEIILEAMGDKEEIDLQAVIKYCLADGQEKLLQSRIFYDLWIILHQRSPLMLTIDSEGTEDSILGEVVDILQDRAERLSVIELTEVLQVGKRYSICNMQLRLEGEGHAL